MAHHKLMTSLMCKDRFEGKVVGVAIAHERLRKHY